MRRSIFVLLTMFALAVAVLAPVAAAGAADTPTVPHSAVDEVKSAKTQTYIVQMLDAPVVAYEGGVKGLSATKPKPGKKINPNSGNVEKYAEYLEANQTDLAASVGAETLYNYVYAYNGFAAELSGEQASALLGNADVLAVTPDELMQLDTVSTPSFLELDAAGGIWDSLGGTADAGEGVIVGIIDSGIWPENPSFSDRTGTNPNGKPGKLDYQQIPGWHGKCTPGEAFPASDCNHKVIGAQWFNSGFGGDAGTKATFPYEFISARDFDGHGSHTASTAAGNYGVPVIVDGADLGTASGIAPRARIAVYKVCWGTGAAGGCFSSDSVAAIDQAVADGVDVLNFSISGSQDSYLDPVEVAFLFAADAGVFVAASAGNSGPGASTVAHNSPWLVTVAAGTHDRYFEGTLNTGDGATYGGAMLASGPIAGDLVYAGNVGLVPGSLEAQQCRLGTLDPTLVSGKIVLCDRGEVARTDKSLEVRNAGGIGMVLANTSPNSVNADLHFVPTIHIDDVAGASARAYSQTHNATAELAGGVAVNAEAPEIAVFSSRGPALAGGDLLKPDIMAPGVDIIAAVAPPGNNGRDFDAYSGTSMSSPHVAGLGALLTDAHPDWSPAMMKSALMTTASQMTNMGNPIAGTPFGYGAGQVAPNLSTDPGLVYDAGWNDWLAFIFEDIDRSDLNYPSISIGEMPGSQTVTRTVTNVGPAATYNVTVDAPAGIGVSVNPASLTLASGASATYEVSFESTESATIDQYAFGSLTWSDGEHNVRSPLVIKPVALAAPAELHESGTEGSTSFDVSFGYSGDFGATLSGFAPADMHEGSVDDDPSNDINTALGTCDFSAFPFDCIGITWELVSIPAGSDFARIQLFDEYTSGDDDLDMYVFTTGLGFVGQSGSGTSAEEVNIDNPVLEYYVAVHGWQTDGGGSADYTLFSWGIGPDLGNATLTAPAAALLGQTETIQVDWAGLSGGTKYLGSVNYSDGTPVGSTVIRIDTD